MAPSSIVSSVPATVLPHTLAGPGVLSWQGSSISSGKHSRRVSSVHAAEQASSTISHVVYALKRRSGNELGSSTSARLLNSTYDSIRDWIAGQRISHLPSEGSSYDKVLAWTQLFIERLHSFDKAIEEFAGDSSLAAELAYGYCSTLLELGKENAPALMTSFRFFYTLSMSLVNLLERTELFSVAQEIREQLVLALLDLVTLVASVATHFHQAIREASTESVSVNIYSTFSGQIRAFHDRCERIAESMWSYQLLVDNQDADAVSDVKLIKSWIAPDDPVLTNVAAGLSLLAHDREELTCLWVAPHLTRFLRSQDRVLTISGKPGSGKSITSSVIVDYLQRPISGVHYNALFIPINSRIPAETSSRAVAKAILSQIFEKRIGNTQLLQILCDTYDRSKLAVTNEEYDDIVWTALERALSAGLPGARELIMVVGGIDEASCGEKALFQRLLKATAHGMNVRLITLGRETHPAAKGLHTIQIGDDLIFDDIMAVVRSDFDSDNEFSSMSEFEQESIIARITEASDGSFLWAKLATKRLRRSIGLDKLRGAVDALVKSKPTITELVLRELQSPNFKDDAKLMLAWLAISERPLSLRELEALDSIQLDKNTISEDKRVDVRAALKHVQGLVFLQDGLMYIRHGLIRSSLVDLIASGQLLSTLKDAHGDLVARLLLYIKTTVKGQHEPSLSVLDSHDTSQLVNKHPLLDLALRYWPIHLTRTAVFASEGDNGAAKAFSAVFPDSITALFLQASLWEQRPKPVLLAYQTTITNIYRQLFTDMSILTLQSLIFLAILHRQVDRMDEAASILFEASSISYRLLGPRHSVTLQMASSYIEITESKVTSTRTEIMTRREEVLIILAECYKAQYSESSTQVITILRQLVEHYRFLHEEESAQKIIAKIRAVTSSKSEGGFGTDSDLHVHLWGKEETTIETQDDTLHLDVEEQDDVIEGHEASDFSFILERAEKGVAEGHFEMAERLYVDLWQRVSEEYRLHRSQFWAERNLKTLLSYSKFLQKHERISEAEAILVSAWTDYSQFSSSTVTETSASLLIQVAHVMKSVGLSEMALSVFRYCEHNYHASSHTHSSYYKEIQESIQIISEEILQTASSSKTVSSESTLVQMVLESSTSIAKVTQSTFTATTTLLSLYISQHRWHDATHFIKQVLRGIWPSLFSANVQDVTLVSDYVETCVDLARRLAECYHARRRLNREEDIRVRIYRALRSGRKVGDALRERATTELLTLYRRRSRDESIITLRQELLDDYTEHYGEEHPTVIKTLWELAELTRPRPIFIEYYQKIIRALNKDSEMSTAEAIEPIILVATELWTRGSLSAALPYYKMLFSTFIMHPEISSRFQDQVWMRESFVRYTECLRSVRTTFTVLHRITSEYYSRCKTLFGANESVTIHATLTLARLCQESKSYEHEAMALYEELLKIESSEIDREDIKANLEILYDEQAAILTSSSWSSSSSSTEVSSKKITRVVKVLRERITSVRETHGWAHEESLFKLTELVQLYTKKEEIETAVRELKTTTIKVLLTETSSIRLAAAATTIATNYIAVNQVDKATELIEEIYHQILIKETVEGEKTEFDLSSRGRESLLFLAQLEYSLHRSSPTLTEILASLTRQYIYFDEWRAALTSSSSFHDVSVASARLHHYLVASGRRSAADHVFKRFRHWFNETEAKRLNLGGTLTGAQVQIFLHSLLEYFGTHKSKDLLRTIGIISNAHFIQLRDKGRFQDAIDLAIASFRYFAANTEAYHSPAIIKFPLILAITVGSRDVGSKIDAETRKKLLETSRVILHDVLRVLKQLKINLAKLGLAHLNRLIGLLGEQQDWPTLASILGDLWASREAQRDWQPSVSFTLVQRLIFARWLVGDSIAALRMAEHVVYNCRRVHSLRHPATLEMSVLLAQLYTGIAQRYQQQQQQGAQANGDKSGDGGNSGAQEMANRYYRKAAAIHENILRVFTDSDYASIDDSIGAFPGGGTGSGTGASPGLGLDGSFNSPLQNIVGHLPPAPAQGSHGEMQHDGQHVRQHLLLLKLAVQRLGAWPKDYAGYEQLNADVFRLYIDDLQGVEGVERWNLGPFGNGKAEADDDLLRPENLGNWELVDRSLHSFAHQAHHEEDEL